MDPLNRKIGELEKLLRERILAFRERVARSTPGLHIPRVFSNIDDTDLDDAPGVLPDVRLVGEVLVTISRVARAQPGDTLAIHIHDMKCDTLGYTAYWPFLYHLDDWLTENYRAAERYGDYELLVPAA